MNSHSNFSSQPILSVVIPLFNESGIIEELCQRVLSSAQKCCEDFEIIFVNDGSIDSTLELLISLSQKYPQIRIINLTRNFGHMSALTAGIRFSKGKALIVMDGDLQDPPELFDSLFKKWKDGAEIVLAIRTKRPEGAFQRIGTKIFYALMSMFFDNLLTRQAGTYCLLDEKIVRIINQFPEKERFFAGIRAWVGFKQEAVYYEREKRKIGKSHVGFLGLMRLGRSGIISFSDAPLRIASTLSFFACFFLLCFGSFIVSVKLFTSLAIPGWASVMVLTGLVGSFISLVLAVLCEYVAVIFKEVKNRPDFLISSEIRKGIEVHAD
jgi:dolichol-phosphate mannosyltransferase